MLDANAANTVAELYRDLQQRAQAELDELADTAEVHWSRYAYMRYAGQGFELYLELPDGDIDQDYVSNIIAAFHDVYQRKHRYRDDTATVEAVDWALVASLPQALSENWQIREKQTAKFSQRQAWFPECAGYTDVTVLNRAALATQESVVGPIILEDAHCTILVLPGDHVSLSSQGDIIIDIAPTTV